VKKLDESRLTLGIALSSYGGFFKVFLRSIRKKGHRVSGRCSFFLQQKIRSYLSENFYARRGILDYTEDIHEIQKRKAGYYI